MRSRGMCSWIEVSHATLNTPVPIPATHAVITRTARSSRRPRPIRGKDNSAMPTSPHGSVPRHDLGQDAAQCGLAGWLVDGRVSVRQPGNAPEVAAAIDVVVRTFIPFSTRVAW